MGSWFSGLHVRKNGTVTTDLLSEYFRKAMLCRKYVPVASSEDADCSIAVVTEEQSQWFSVYSDSFSFEEVSRANFAVRMSEDLKTEILGISCFDSDYLYLNLINASSGTGAWAGVGSAAGLGLHRRNNLSAWKNHVDDFDTFKASMKKKYIFAEEVLAEIENCIHLPKENGAASYEYLEDLGLSERAVCLYFKLPEDAVEREKPTLELSCYPAEPCFLEKCHAVSVRNVGGGAKGLSVFFTGSYVENDEITFSDVSLIKHNRNGFEFIPVELKKVRLTDGRSAYCFCDPEYKILPKVDNRLPALKKYQVEMEREIRIRFIPH